MNRTQQVDRYLDGTASTTRTLAEAIAGDVFHHATTGAEIVVVEHSSNGELLTVQLNEAEGLSPGWIGVMWASTAVGWSFVRNVP
jgi:hypothetical protein